MDAFAAREQGFELAFAHDEELRFKILACRNVMFARWGADRLGYVGETADRYVEKIAGILNAHADAAPRAENRAVGRLLLDLTTSGWELTRQDILKALAECEARARRAVMAR
jgi:hypothetical protein